METLFKERPEIPSAVKDRPPTPDQCAIETFNLPKEWRHVGWAKKGHTADPEKFSHLEIRGGVYRHKYLRGKRKGQTNYTKPEPGSEATVSLSPVQIKEWEDRWESEMGFCRKCSGTGYAWNGWSATDGTSYRACERCETTGKKL